MYFPPQGAYAGYYPPQMPRKHGKGLLIGLISGGVVLIAAAVLLFIFLTGGTPVTGLWYNEEYGQVLDFKDNAACMSTHPRRILKGYLHVR
jgi:hypothetical protein